MQSRTARRVSIVLAAGATVALAATVLATPAFATATTVRISSAPDGGPGKGFSNFAAVNASGRYVTFVSSAANLVPSDTNGTSDIFLRDRISGAIERISVSSTGAQADSFSWGPANLSRTGRYVVFASAATNLVRGDTNNEIDVFLRDRVARTTRLVSVSSRGALARRDSYGGSVSADGRYVAFTSYAETLVRGDRNGKRDVFVHDMRTGRTRLVSVRRDGTQGDGDSATALISNDGRYVAFLSTSTNFGTTNLSGGNDAYVKDLRTGALDLVSRNSQGKQFYAGPAELSMSGDGRYVAFSASELFPYQTEVYVRDLKLKTTVTASVTPGGTNAGGLRPSISASGRYVAFTSGSRDIDPHVPPFEHVYVRDLRADTTTLAGRTSSGGYILGHQSEPAMSDSGVAFRAEVPGIVPGGDDSANLFQVYFHSL
jgi:Tol biopolymer transport system component